MTTRSRVFRRQGRFDGESIYASWVRPVCRYRYPQVEYLHSCCEDREQRRRKKATADTSLTCLVSCRMPSVGIAVLLHPFKLWIWNNHMIWQSLKKYWLREKTVQSYPIKQKNIKICNFLCCKAFWKGGRVLWSSLDIVIYLRVYCQKLFIHTQFLIGGIGIFLWRNYLL